MHRQDTLCQNSCFVQDGQAKHCNIAPVISLPIYSTKQYIEFLKNTAAEIAFNTKKLCRKQW